MSDLAAYIVGGVLGIILGMFLLAPFIAVAALIIAIAK